MRGERGEEVYRRESKTMRGERRKKAIAGRWNKTMRGKKREQRYGREVERAYERGERGGSL